MPLRSSRLICLPAVLAYILLAGCASVGSQPPVYVEDPKAKAQDPCPAQEQSPQDKSAKDACKKTQPK
jgi:hypothetical protein